MYAPNSRTASPSRLICGALAAVLQLAVVILVWTGFSPQIVHNGLQNALTSLDFRQPEKPPLPRQPSPRRSTHSVSGHAAAAHIHSHAAAIVAPAVIALTPPPVVAATAPGTGNQASAGAAPIQGPGSGAGGNGQGTGSGNSGDGEGDSGRDVELIGGRIKDSDIPQALREAPFSGTTRTEVGVTPRGKVSTCRTLRSSGNSVLDELTCRLILQRFRFRPALDARGQPQGDHIIYSQDWAISGQFEDGSAGH